MLPIATVVALQTMWASSNTSQDCRLLFLIEHLYVFFSVRVRSAAGRCGGLGSNGSNFQVLMLLFVVFSLQYSFLILFFSC